MEVEEKYEEDMNNLRRENSELRCQVMQRSEQFQCYKFQMERAHEKVTNGCVSSVIATHLKNISTNVHHCYYQQVRKGFGERASVLLHAKQSVNLGPALGLHENGSTARESM